MKDILETCRAH